MKRTGAGVSFLSLLGVAILLVAGFATGCKSRQAAAPTDQQIAEGVQTKLHGEAALTQQNIQTVVAGGVVTLSGSVTDEASRALAAGDAATIPGVKTVVNNLVVQPLSSSTAPSSQPVAAPVTARNTQPAPAPRNGYNAPQPAPQPVARVEPAAPAPQPAPKPEPPRPVVKQVTLPAGTVLPIRLTEALSSQSAQVDDPFHGSLATDIGTQGVIALPHGSAVQGRVVDVREAAHFKGNSLLSIELTQISAAGRRITLVTEPFSRQGEGRGKNTALKAGGGAALGSIIGALAGGGKGAAIGALAGAGAGTGVNAATRGQQVVIPSETLINFQLQSPITLTVTIPPHGYEAHEGLHSR